MDWVGYVGENSDMEKLILSDSEWRKRLTPEQFRGMRKHGTEAPFCSRLNDEPRTGVYACAACGLELFSSAHKFESKSGWPSFYQPVAKDVVETQVDRKLGMLRTEVHCARCEGHLGHVFEDGPRPTGLRYCMNGAALQFSPS